MGMTIDEYMAELNRKKEAPAEPQKPAETGDFWTDMRNRWEHLNAQEQYNQQLAESAQNPHSGEMLLGAFNRERFLPEIRLQELRSSLKNNLENYQNKTPKNELQKEAQFKKWLQESDRIRKEMSDIVDKHGVTPQAVIDLDENLVRGNKSIGVGLTNLNDNQKALLLKQIEADFKERYPKHKVGKDTPNIPTMSEQDVKGPFGAGDALSLWIKEEENRGTFRNVLGTPRTEFVTRPGTVSVIGPQMSEEGATLKSRFGQSSTFGELEKPEASVIDLDKYLKNRGKK